MSDELRGMRSLGDASARTDAAPTRPEAPSALRDAALAQLQKEFADALALKQRLTSEADPDRSKEKGRGIIASLEGAVRLALRLGLIDVPASRQLFADAQKSGLYEGWR